MNPLAITTIAVALVISAACDVLGLIHAVVDSKRFERLRREEIESDRLLERERLKVEAGLALARERREGVR